MVVEWDFKGISLVLDGLAVDDHGIILGYEWISHLVMSNIAMFHGKSPPFYEKTHYKWSLAI